MVRRLLVCRRGDCVSGDFLSAAEKLRALEAAMVPAPWETKRWPHRATELIGPADPEHPGYRLLTRPAKDLALVASLRNALPQIVAVVEAAEELQGVAGGVIWLNNNMHMYGNDEWRGYFKAVLRDARRGYESAAALTALDEALTT